MADISTYLARILKAVYGEEVRGSIHDAIEAMNIECIQAKNDASVAKDSARQSANSASRSASEALASKNRSEEILVSVQKVNDTVDGKVESVMSLKWNLIANHCINDELLDSSETPLLDSNGEALIATTIYADAYDIARLNDRISALESAIKYMESLLYESRMLEAESFINKLITHSLLDNGY